MLRLRRLVVLFGNILNLQNFRSLNLDELFLKAFLFKNNLGFYAGAGVHFKLNTSGTKVSTALPARQLYPLVPQAPRALHLLLLSHICIL